MATPGASALADLRARSVASIGLAWPFSDVARAAASAAWTEDSRPSTWAAVTRASVASSILTLSATGAGRTRRRIDTTDMIPSISMAVSTAMRMWAGERARGIPDAPVYSASASEPPLLARLRLAKRRNSLTAIRPKMRQASSGVAPQIVEFHGPRLDWAPPAPRDRDSPPIHPRAKLTRGAGLAKAD